MIGGGSTGLTDHRIPPLRQAPLVSSNNMKVSVFIILIIAFFTTCKSNRKYSTPTSSGTIDIHENKPSFAPFSKDTQLVLYSGLITLPKGWRLANDDTLLKTGDATSRYRFHNRNGKLVFLQYGLGTIGNPAEPNVLSNRFRKGYIKNNADTSDIIFTDNPVLNKIRRKSNYNFSSKTISTFQATFFKPKHSGNGFIGIYIDSIGQIAGNIADLVLYAESFDHIESKELEKMFQSLVIKDFK